MASRRVCGRLGRGRHGFAGCGMGKATEIPGLSGGRTGSPWGNLRKASAPAAENAPLFSGAPRWKMPSGILSRGALLPVQRSARCFPVGKRSTISRPRAVPPAQRSADASRWKSAPRLPHAHRAGKALAGVVARRLANESVQPEFSTAWTDRLALRESRRCGDQRCGAASKPRLPPRTRVDKASALCAAARAVSRFRSNVSMDRPGRIRRLPHYGKQRQRRERCSPVRRPQSDRAEARKARAPSLWKRSLRRRQRPGDGTGRRRGAMLFCR